MASTDPTLPPDAPALVVGLTEAVWLTADGEVETIALADAARRVRAAPAMLCHGRAMARRLGVAPFAALDLLELFAFVRPARFCLPTPRGLAAALDLPRPQGLAGAALTLVAAARALIVELAAAAADDDARIIAEAMARGGWAWGEAALAALAARAARPPETAPTAREHETAPAGRARSRRLPA